MALQAIRTRVLPGVSVYGNRRVAVFAAAGKVRMVISVPELFEGDAVHREAVRQALKRFPDGWQGNYAGGMFDGDCFWVRFNEADTPKSDMADFIFDWKGQSA